MGDVTGVETETEVSGTDGVDNPAVTDDTNSEATGSESAAGAEDTGAETGGGEGAAEGDGDGDAGAEGSQTPPDTYADFAMPEGMEIDESVLAEAAPLFKEAGLTQEQAQKFVDLQAKLVQAGAEKQVDAFNQQLDEWRQASATDKEFGGDAFEENVKIAQAAVSKFGTPELTQLLEDYGVGNHPEVIRFMVKVGKLTAEDNPGSDGSLSQSKTDVVDQLYPNDRKN